jgi:hypothetical protein
MYFLFALFFGSLLGIIFMIGRKLAMIQNGEVQISEETFLKVPYFEEWKYVTIKNIRKHSYNVLVATVRFYIRSSSYLKNKYLEVKIKIVDIYKRNSDGDSGEKREVSKFLKLISEYKHKIRKIKHKIKEEEDSL